MSYIDIHSHILPWLDDGSRSMEQTIAMLQIAQTEGIGTIYATPHCMPGKGQPTREKIQERMERVQQEAARQGIAVTLKAGTEYYYREEMLEWLEQGEIITMGDSDCVLVEFEPMAERSYIRNAVREILGLGYCPIVAHVERYVSLMEKGFSAICEMKQMGALFQVNCASVTGENGRFAKKNARELLKNQLIDFVSTDSHSHGSRAPYMEKCANLLRKKYGEAYSKALTCENAVYYL